MSRNPQQRIIDHGMIGARPDNLLEAIVWLTRQADAIPEQYRQGARLEISAEDDDYGCVSACVSISYVRPETPSEVEARRRDDAHRRKLLEARERAEFERLRLKFHSGKAA